MERIMKIGTLFIIVTLACLMAIITADGTLSWETIGLALLIILVAAFAFAVWTVVHNTFDKLVEIGLTVGIVILGLMIFVLAAMVGAEIKDMVVDAVSGATVLWLVWPLVGTIAITLVFGLHLKPRRTSARRP